MNKKFQELLAKYQRNQIVIDELPEDEARRLNLQQTFHGDNPYTVFSIDVSDLKKFTTDQIIAMPGDFMQDWVGDDGYASREVYAMNMKSLQTSITSQDNPKSWIREGWEAAPPRKSASGYAACFHCGSTNFGIDGPCKDCGQPPFLRRKS